MNNNQINNTKKQVPTGINLTEKDYLSSLLSCLKEMEKNYVVAMTEASNENLYQQYKGIFDELSSLQRETYEMMFKCGWYILEQAESNKVKSKHQMLLQEYQDLNL